MTRHSEDFHAERMLNNLFSSLIFVSVPALSLFGIFISAAMIFILAKYHRFRSIFHFLICNACVAAAAFLSIHIEISFNAFQSAQSTDNSNCSAKSYALLLFTFVFIYSNVLQAISHLSAILPSDRQVLLRRRSTLLLLVLICWILSSIIPTFPLALDVFVPNADISFCSIFGSSLIVDLYLIFFILILPSIVIVSSYVYVRRRVRLLNSPILRMMGTDFAMRIWAKKYRRELKNSFVLLVHLAIFAAGYLPMLIFVFVRTDGVPSEFLLFCNAVLPVSLTILLAVTCLTNRWIRKILIPKRRFSTLTRN